MHIKRKLLAWLLLLLLLAEMLPSDIFALTPKYDVSDSYKSSPYYEALLGVTLTGNQREDLIAVAKSQIGYHESNSSSDLSGSSTSGTGNYTEYNRWYSNPGVAWCAIFVSWCANMANIPTSVMKKASRANCDSFGCTWFGRDADRTVEITYTPTPGDLIFYDYEKDGFNLQSPASSYGDHIGIVVDVDDTYVYTVEGNASNQVSTYKKRRDSVDIKGYGLPNYSSGSTGISSGSCGSNLSWSLNSSGTLTISGTGSMNYWNTEAAVPWSGRRGDVKKVVISQGVTSIGYYAFYGMTALKTISIPASVTVIGANAFRNCVALTEIQVDESNTAFLSKNGVLYTEDGSCLLHCPAGKSGALAVPSGTLEIAEDAFQSAEGLTKITIPASVEYIGENAFDGCTSLEMIAVSSSNAVYSSQNGVLFTVDGSRLIRYPEGKTGSYQIPEDVCEVGPRAFVDVVGLKKLTFPASVEIIMNGALSGCMSLENVIFEGKPMTISEDMSGTTLLNGITGKVGYYDDFDWTTSEQTALGGSVTWVEMNTENVRSATVTITAAQNVGTGIRLTWGAVKSALKYRVYYKIKGASSYTKYKDVTSTSVTVTELTLGQSYVFVVKAMRGSVVSSGKASAATLYEAIPAVTSATSTGSGMKVTWSTVEGATKYRLYYKIKGGSYATYGDYTGTSATVTGLTHGNAYIFTVKAYVNGSWTGNVGSSAYTFSAWPTVSKITNASGGLKVTWGAVAGATKYRVYYKLSGASSYTKFGDTKNTYATVTGLTSGKSYVLTVRAYVNGSWTGHKASSAFTYCATPTVKKLTNGKTGVTLTWDKITGATSYKVYYKLSDASEWTLFTTTTEAKATVTGLTSGKSYLFALRAGNSSGWSAYGSSSVLPRVGAVTLSGVTNSAEKTAKATWKKDTGVTGYQLQYSLNSDFSSSKTVKITSASTVSKSISSLTKGKTYYFRIRGYKTLDSTTYTGVWSEAKSVKIAK